jgi:hypothetical protein
MINFNRISWLRGTATSLRLDTRVKGAIVKWCQDGKL